MDNKVYALKAPTGIGKTELYTSLENAIIALSSHTLIEEISRDRMKIDHLKTPSTDSLEPYIKTQLEYLYSIGAINRANHLLTEVKDEYESVKKYRDQCLRCYGSTKTVLTTHQKGLHINWLHDKIIFDEDIIGTLLPIEKLSISDLLILENRLSGDKDKKVISELINSIREDDSRCPQRTNEYITFDDLELVEREILTNSSGYSSDILHFFRSDYYLKNPNDPTSIHYITKFNLPNDKKIIILSATINEDFYKTLFGDRLIFNDLSTVKLTGLVEQYPKHSFSQTSLRNHLDEAIALVGSLPVITFKKYADNFANPIKNLYFWKSTGSNQYQGQDIAVVGTPHPNPVVVALHAKALDIEFSPNDLSVKQQEVYHNGFKFWFNTYSRPELRAIHFHLIESELRQAIGRARVNTTHANVKLYSNYPLPEACITDEEITEGRRLLEERKR